MPGLAAGLRCCGCFLLVKPLTSLRQTLISVWLAYTIVWLAYGMRLVSGFPRGSVPSSRKRRSHHWRDGSQVQFDVTVPLVRYGMLAGWVLVFLIFVREYSTGVYLLAPGTEVIGSLLVSLWGAGRSVSFRLCRLSMWA